MLLLLVLLPARAGHAQVSPGELSAPHARLGGMAGCPRCHEGDGGALARRCLDCHGEIRVQLREGRGFHAVMGREEMERRCGECHAEHNGRDFQLVFWKGGIEFFDHRRATGFILEGRHARTDCRGCHRRDYIVKNLVTLNPEIDLDRTFLGLGVGCTDCHRDVHRSQFRDRSCEACHGLDSWKPVPLFSHDRSRYPLTGRHRAVPCGKCHPAAGGTVDQGSAGDGVRDVRYVGLAFDDCSSCHPFRHRTELGKRCDGCHTPEGWQPVDRKGFDHRRTRFELRGRHGTAPCESCHRPELRGAALRFERCVDCHRDVHQGGLRTDRYVGRCELCHNEDRFVPSSFGLVEHDRGPFPLTGAHRAVPCTGCHRKAPGNGMVSFLFPSTDCPTCHRDPHRGQFQGRGAYTGCESCHRTDRWALGEFDHQKTAFPLDGLHINVRCEGCHPLETGADGAAYVRYRPLGKDCRDCHAGTAGRVAGDGNR